MRTVGEYCNRSVIVVRPEQSLREAAQRMREHHVGCVIVIESTSESQNRPIGIITDRDLVVRALAQTDRHLEQIRVDDVMARPVITVGESDELGDALETMRDAGVRRLPVLDESQSVVGLLSFDDLIRHYQGSFGAFASLLDREQAQERRAVRS
jgi:CBS domain-containing protein